MMEGSRDYHDDGDDKDIKDQLNILALPTDMIFVTSSTSSACQTFEHFRFDMFMLFALMLW